MLVAGEGGHVHKLTGAASAVGKTQGKTSMPAPVAAAALEFTALDSSTVTHRLTSLLLFKCKANGCGAGERAAAGKHDHGEGARRP